VNSAAQPVFEFEVEIVAPGRIPTAIGDDQDLSVRFDAGRWCWSAATSARSWTPPCPTGASGSPPPRMPSTAAFRIVHSLLLARQGGLLVHAASVVRNGRAFLFAGVSGAGKTTISRLAPPDATLLTDEISYLRREADGYFAYGTPFAGELAQPGENVRAPLAALYLLAQGTENRIDPVAEADALREVLRCVLFFAHDSELVGHVFDSVCPLGAARSGAPPDLCSRFSRVGVDRMSTVYIARVKEVAARSIGGEMMIMSARDSTLFSLNETATAIWQAADGVTPLAEIVQRSLCAQFELTWPLPCAMPKSWWKGLAKHGILKVSDLPIEETP